MCIALVRNSGAVGSALECRSSGERGDSRTARESCLSKVRLFPRGRRRGRASVGACIASCDLPLRLQLGGGLCARRGRNLQLVILQSSATGYAQRAASRRQLLLAVVLRRRAPAFGCGLSGSWRKLARISVCSLGRQALERDLLSCGSGVARNTRLKLRLTCLCGGLRLARDANRR